MLSIAVFGLNEEKHLEATVRKVHKCALECPLDAFEIIVVNDGSTDGTGKIADSLAAELPHVKVIHNPVNKGIGASILIAANAARYDKFVAFAGDDHVTPHLIISLFKVHDAAEFVASYTINTEYRGRLRNTLSSMYSYIYTTIFDVPLKYINGHAVYPTRRLLNLNLRSNGYSFVAEAAIKFMRQGVKFIEIGTYVNQEIVKSSAVRPKVLFEVIMSFLRLFFEIFVQERLQYSKRSQRVWIPMQQ